MASQVNVNVMTSGGLRGMYAAKDIAAKGDLLIKVPMSLALWWVSARLTACWLRMAVMP
jgi:hypothetical protein